MTAEWVVSGNHALTKGKMRIAVGSDHRGSMLRARVIEFLRDLGHEVKDFGTHDRSPIDYPDVACLVAEKVSYEEVDRGILLSGTGLGMSVAANKYRGVRAAACHDDFAVERSRRHLDLNVLCLPADLIGEELAIHLVETWVTTPFEGGRHARRVDKISELEKQTETAPRQRERSAPR
jgi:ribose 5-phosphate isomerase B